MLDLDEILGRVKDTQVKQYLKEAITSYKIGNYRSAIITSWIAAMFNLINKFQILVQDRESIAIKHWKIIKPKIENHQNWETELIQAAKASDMISQYELNSLENLREKRNKYAHPSFDEIGELFEPTPEEVRYFIRSLYDLVFSQPAQLGSFYVNKIIQNIKKTNFFAHKPFIEELYLSKELVVEKFSKVNKRQSCRLIKSMFKDLYHPDDKDHKNNLLCFIINLWEYVDDDIVTEISMSFDQYIDEGNLDDEVFAALITYPEKIITLSSNSQIRLKNIFKEEILRKNFYANSINKLLSFSDLLPDFKRIFDNFISHAGNHNQYTASYIFDILDKKLFIEKFGHNLIKDFREKLKTQNGYIVNPALEKIQQYDLWEIANNLSEEEKPNFAQELINSVQSNNFGTMSLLSYKNSNDIPNSWISMIFIQWCDLLLENNRQEIKHFSYLKQFLNLAYRYEQSFKTSKKFKDVLSLMTPSLIEDLTHETQEFNEVLQKFWNQSNEQ